MIAPSREMMFCDVPVSHSAATVPSSASSAPAMIDSGSKNERNSSSNTVNTSRIAISITTSRL